MGDTRRDSTLSLGLNTFYFENPGSITKVIPSIVREVSAIFVAITIFLPGTPFLFGGGGSSNIFYCIKGGKVEYKGIHLTGPASGPNFSSKKLRYLLALHKHVY